MDKLRTAQKVLRTAFTRQLNQLNELILAREVSKDDVAVTFQMFENRIKELDNVHAETLSLMMETTNEDDINWEVNNADEYRVRYYQAKQRASRLLEVPRTIPEPTQNGMQLTTADHRKTYEYPQLEIPKFNGNVREWLQFWSIFKKVHEDGDVNADDKFHYLLQAVVPGSRAHELVRSYLPTGENYNNAIECLKQHFSHADLLVEVYV